MVDVYLLLASVVYIAHNENLLIEIKSTNLQPNHLKFCKLKFYNLYPLILNYFCGISSSLIIFCAT